MGACARVWARLGACERVWARVGAYERVWAVVLISLLTPSFDTADKGAPDAAVLLSLPTGARPMPRPMPRNAPLTLDESSGASQPACQMCPYGAAQPLETYVAQCVGIKVLNFKMRMPQLHPNRKRVFNVFERQRWNRLRVTRDRTRARKMRDVLAKLGHPSANDSVLCSEVAGCKGFRASVLDFRHFVQEGLLEASYFTDGAYLNLWNVPINIAAEVQAGTWKASTAQPNYMHWQAFDLTYEAPQFAARDAPQLAAPKVGLLVGNMHIPAGDRVPTKNTRRRILEQALQHLTSLEVDAWRTKEDFQVMRLLVGNCNLTKEDAFAATQNIQLPPLTALQRDLKVRRWEVLSTDAELPGDMMFVLGGLAEERTVPIGASFEDHGVRDDALFQHDAVAAQLMIPVGKIHPVPPPAAGGAPQPAATASSASSAGPPQPTATASSAASGAPQPAATASNAKREISPTPRDPPQPAAMASKAERDSTRQPTPPRDTDPISPISSVTEHPTPPDWPGSESEHDTIKQESSLSKTARDLHKNLRIVEQADDIPPEIQLELRKILFKRTTEVAGGLKRQYCATLSETRQTIKNLLKIRRDFMVARGLKDGHPTSSAASQRDGPSGGASQPTDHRYLFTQEDRKQVMKEWKDEFHAMRAQVEQQKRDSWKPKGPPTDTHDEWGTNTKAVQKGKHSRFARHLQLAAGSKTMAELIIYTGRFDPNFLSQAHAAQDRSGASQPDARAGRQAQLKRAAAQVGGPQMTPRNNIGAKR